MMDNEQMGIPKVAEVNGWTLTSALGEIARAVGSAAFHDNLLQLLAMLVDWDRRLVVGYFDDASPQIHLSQGVPQGCRDLYLSSYYQFDPFLRYWTGTRQCGVVTLHDVASLDPNGTFVNVFNEMVGVSDEVGILLPWFCGATLGLFLERTCGQYSVEMVRLLRDLYPLILGLQEAHLSYVASKLELNARKTAASHGSQAVLVTSARGERLFSSNGWDKAENDLPGLLPALQASWNEGVTLLSVDDRHALAVQPLQLGQPALDDGRIYVLRKSPVPTSTSDMISDLDYYFNELTKREAEIVKLIFAGYPTQSIAEKLGISVGTVKNHRNSIYEKLDITAERDLFLLLLGNLGYGPSSAWERHHSPSSGTA